MRKLDTLPASHEIAELESGLTVIGYGRTRGSAARGGRRRGRYLQDRPVSSP